MNRRFWLRAWATSSSATTHLGWKWPLSLSKRQLPEGVVG